MSQKSVSEKAAKTFTKKGMKEKSSRILDENSIKGPENEEEWREK